jgi:hypothetical protein
MTFTRSRSCSGVSATRKSTAINITIPKPSCWQCRLRSGVWWSRARRSRGCLVNPSPCSRLLLLLLLLRRLCSRKWSLLWP